MTIVSDIPQSKLERTIQHQLADLLLQGVLDPQLTAEMVPSLARALQPQVAKYQATHGQFPTSMVFQTMANNYNQDGPLVQALLDYNSPTSAQLWQVIHQKLLRQAQYRWPHLDVVYQDKVVGEAYLRVYRYLPNFLFLARLDSWIFTILKNEYLRLKSRSEQEQQAKQSLDEPIGDNLTWADQIPSKLPEPSALTDQQQLVADFWARLERLEKQSGVTLLKLHLAGYKLKEIQAELGADSPVLSTIQRRIQRILQKIETDPEMNELAQRLGVMRVLLYLLWHTP